MNDYSSSKDQCPSACRQMALIFWVYGSPFFTWMALEANMSLSLGLAGAVLPAASGGCCCCCCWTLPSEGLIIHPRRQTIINVLSLIILHSSQGDTDLPHSTPCGDTHTERERERERDTHTTLVSTVCSGDLTHTHTHSSLVSLAMTHLIITHTHTQRER